MLTNKLYRHDSEIWRYEDHWGEPKNSRRRILSPETIRSIIVNSEKPERPKDLVFPSDGGDNDPKTAQVSQELFPVNEVIRHNIHLNAYSKKLQRHIRVLATRKSEFRGPPLSEMSRIPEMRRKDPGLKGVRSAGTSGQLSPLPQIDRDVSHKLLERAVICILAQCGYDKASSTALLVLVDVIKEFLTKICTFCHVFAQKDLSRDMVSYDDVLEKALCTIGLDGIQSVKDYYKKKVVLKRDRALLKAKRFLTVYEKLLRAHGFLGTNEESGPQIHLPATQNSEALNAILGPGLRMLQALDQQTQQGGESSSFNQ